jgi:guanylate kinase
LNNASPRRSGILFVLSAPSGAGKTTLTSALRSAPDFVYSVSCTTRPPRPGEAHGTDYFFLEHDHFRRHIDAGDFLEFADVHGNFYGTLKSTVLASLVKGVDVLLDIDTAGAASIRACDDPVIRDALADIFLMPPGFAELERRLRGRGTETEAQIATRLRNASAEIEHRPRYRYTLVSGTREDDIRGFRSIMRAERSISRRLDFSIQ